VSPRKNPHQHKLELGASGEHRAAEFLLAKNWRLLASRYRAGQDEIDLIAFDPQFQELVFVEVKTRAKATLVAPEEALNGRKLAALTRAVNHYLKAHPQNYDYRFDLITVLPDKIQHFENITWP
jgi:putative endonuclease